MHGLAAEHPTTPPPQVASCLVWLYADAARTQLVATWRVHVASLARGAVVAPLGAAADVGIALPPLPALPTAPLRLEVHSSAPHVLWAAAGGAPLPLGGGAHRLPLRFAPARPARQQVLLSLVGAPGATPPCAVLVEAEGRLPPVTRTLQARATRGRVALQPAPCFPLAVHQACDHARLPTAAPIGALLPTGRPDDAARGGAAAGQPLPGAARLCARPCTAHARRAAVPARAARARARRQLQRHARV